VGPFLRDINIDFEGRKNSATCSRIFMGKESFPLPCLLRILGLFAGLQSVSVVKSWDHLLILSFVNGVHKTRILILGAHVDFLWQLNIMHTVFGFNF
jgi:hypothetical protein